MPHHQSFSKVGERAGLAVIATAGLTSAVSTSTLLSYIVWNSFLTRDKNTPLHLGIRSFTRSSLGYYLISLLICDFVQGVAFSLNYRWAVVGGMTEASKVCTVQGAVSEVGDLGAALWSIAIGIHTFSLLFFVRKPPRFMAPIVLGLGWSTIIILPIVGPAVIQTSKRGAFYGLSGAWCWIGTGYNIERLIYLYIWVFTALGSSFFVYTLIYLRFSNFITVNGNGRLALNFRRQHDRPISVVSQTLSRGSERLSTTSLPGCFDWTKAPRDATVTSGSGSAGGLSTNGRPEQVSGHLRHVARRLMWYPILYTIVVVPVSVCRMGVLAGWQPPFGLLVFAGTCFAGSGISNVILFITTRHSFIKHVAMNHGGTRVLVTTQRVTIRDESGIELSGIKTESAMTSPITPKSTCFASFEDPANYVATTKEDISVASHDHQSSEIGDVVERRPGLHVTVLGK